MSFRVAVVGSGPAGFYAAAALLASDLELEVDMIERLPTPWGLVRLGVAPDHPNIKAVSRAFEKTAALPGLPLLRQRRGRQGRRRTTSWRASTTRSSTPSARRPTASSGSLARTCPARGPATEFVAWYNGHPDFQELSFDLSGERAVVIGNGNVALDVARMLALTPEELAPTDTTDAAIEAINAAGIREILVVGRRGPVQAAWTPVEVGELGELAGADVIVDPADLELDAASEAELAAAAPTVRRNVDHLRDYAAREPAGKPRAIRLRFFSSPVAIHGDGKVEAIELVRNELVDGRAVADRGARDDPVRDRLPQRRLPGRAAPGRAVRRGLGDDPERGRPRRAGALRGRLDQARPERRDRDEQEGRDRDGRAPARGRARRAAARAEARERSRQLLEERGVDAVLYAGWEAIDEAERTAGEPHGRPRIKLCTWDDLLAAAKTSLAEESPVSGTAGRPFRPTIRTVDSLNVECLRCGHAQTVHPRPAAA